MVNSSESVFITFEGGEGAGKTTLIETIATHLSSYEYGIVCTREPGGTTAAEAIRDLVVKGDKDRWDATSETALFLTARHTHVEQLIQPALDEGKIVLCDRFMDSTLVYQGIAKGLGLDYVQQLSSLIVGDIVPDLTFLIDIDPEVGLKRTKGRAGDETRFEAHSLAFHQSIREGFLRLAEANPDRMVIIDGGLTEGEVFEATKAHIDNYLGT